MDASGNVYVTGSFNGSITSGVPQTLTQVGSSNNTFVVQLNSSGVVPWAKSFGGTNYVQPSGITVDGSGNVYVTGFFYGSITSGVPQTLTSSGSACFLVQLNAGGLVTSATGFGSGGFYPSIAVTGTGGVVLTGNANKLVGNQLVSGSFVYWGSQASLAFSPATTNSGLSFGKSQATGDGSVALGMNSLASATGAIAMGGGTSLGQYSFSGGQGKAIGRSSIAFGEGSTASGDYSTALGGETNASGYSSTAFGEGTQAVGDYSTAFGYYTTAQAFGSIAIGSLNVAQGNSTTWIPTDDLFVIGNGNPDTWEPSNALVVKKNGDTTINGAMTVTGRSKILVEPQGDLSMGSFTAQ